MEIFLKKGYLSLVWGNRILKMENSVLKYAWRGGYKGGKCQLGLVFHPILSDRGRENRDCSYYINSKMENKIGFCVPKAVLL